MAGAAIIEVDEIPASDADLARVPKDLLEKRAAMYASLGIDPANPDAPATGDDAAAVVAGDDVIPVIDVPGAHEADAAPAAHTPDANEPVPASFADDLAALKSQMTQLQTEVPALRQALQDKDADIARLQRELETARNAPVMTEAITPEALKALGIAEETLDAGLDLFQAMGLMIDARVRPVIRQEIDAAIQSGAVVNGQVVYRQQRAERLPEWESLNGNDDAGKRPDPDWVTFLNGKDKVARMTRRELAQAANDAADLDALEALMEQFYGAHPTKKPQSNGQHDAGKANGNGAAKRVAIVPLDQQVKPPTRATGQTAAVKPNYTESQYKAVMRGIAERRLNGSDRDKRTGEKWTDAQLAAARQTMEDAAREKRILWGK